MIGQGGPKTSRKRYLPVAWKAAAARAWGVAVALSVIFSSHALMADDLRVRIAWGGGADRLWFGTVSLSEGSFAKPCPLGIEADESGSIWLEGNATKLIIHQHSPRGYDGVDVRVSAASSAKLLLRFSTADAPDRPTIVEIPLTDLLSEPVNRELDQQGNRLLVMRAPGDSLRVHFTRDNLVFSPGEIFKFVLEPCALPLPKGVNARVKIQLLDGDRELWSRHHEVAADRPEPIPLEIALPGEEGVYDIAITASGSPNWSQAVRQPLKWKRTIAQRKLQLLVLEPRRPPSPRTDQAFTSLVEIDPANPRWFELLNKLPQLQLTKPRMPRLWKGPLGNDCRQTQRHVLGNLVRLHPNDESPDVSWEAYWLPISQPGRPHILEVDYPSDVSQTLGISLVEPNAAGALTPLGVESGVDNAGEAVGSDTAPRWLRHRLVFWPRTTTPLLLVTNGRDREPAVYGKIRVLAGGGQRLPQALSEGAGTNRRLLAAYLDRPLFPENFAARESLDSWSNRSLDSWQTFHEGGTRLIEYLNYVGYNGLMLAVLADGSTIYPSSVLEPTPRYDTGVFFASGQDPVRKDVLEMLFRLFDREDLQLIPTVEFASPLPELEAILRAGGPDAHGIEWIGANGASWCASQPTKHGLAPYYNVLHPRVQQAMLDVLRELVGRYARHPSLTGVAVRLSADGYAQLPGPDWGLDDVTIAQFERDTNRRVPGEGPQRFAQRAAFFAQMPQHQAWLEWRAAQLAKFYRRVYLELTSIRPGSRLYLAGVGMIGGTELEPDLRPALPQQSTVADTLLRVGIDARLYNDDRQRIVLLRPERIVPEGNLGNRAADLEIGQMTDIDRYFQNLSNPGSLFFHPPREVRIESFDRKSPFEPSYTWLISQPAPADQQNRRRFVHSLATLDAQTMVDGGWVLPMGEEAAMRNLVAAYRCLPAIRFQSVGKRPGADASQPTTFRHGVYGGRTYLYAVNDAPFPITARVHIEAAPACRIEELTGLRKIAPLKADGRSGKYWEVRLEPYDLVAVRFSEPGVRCSDPHVTWPGAVETALRSRIRELGARAAALRNPPPLDVVMNPNFELPNTGDTPISGWAVSTHRDIDIHLDNTQGHKSRQSIKIASDGPVACLVSQPFTAPGTGRFTMSVWLRVADVAKQPPLRLALEGKLDGHDYYRFAPVGLAPGPGQPSVPITSEWGQYVFQVDDLPLKGLTSLRARFDLMGPGEVWVDDVQVFGLAFSRPEMVELSKLITLADVKLQHGQVGDCFHLLEGYWPQFLEAHVPLPAGAAMHDATATKPRDAERPPPERSGLLNRVKGMLPDSLRF